LIEREIPFRFKDLQDVKIFLYNPDVTTAKRIAEDPGLWQCALDFCQGHIATALDPSTVQLVLPPRYRQNPFELVAAIEQQ